MKCYALVFFILVSHFCNYEAKAVKGIKIKAGGKQFKNVRFIPEKPDNKAIKPHHREVRYVDDEYIVFTCYINYDTLDCYLPKDAIISLAEEIINPGPGPGPGPQPTQKPDTDTIGGELIPGVLDYCDEPEENVYPWDDYYEYYNH